MVKKCILLGSFILLIVLIFMSQGLKREYKKSVKHALELNTESNDGTLTLYDIQYLPEPVQRYITYVGAIGKPKVYNFKATADCEMQMNNSGWVKGNFEQYNFFGSHITRLFYLKLNMFSIFPVYALHSYTDEKASMLVKVLGLVPVVDVKGKEMRISDTVTLLNDMCIFAPAALIDNRIKWELINNKTVKAIFNTDYCTVSAILYFNDKSELVSFESNDRYDVKGSNSYKKYKWSTPLQDYKEINGIKLASCIEAIWDMPSGPYSYFKMTNLRDINYNCKK